MVENEYKSGSNLEKVLERGDFAVTAELGPPKSVDLDVMEKKVELLKGWVIFYKLNIISIAAHKCGKNRFAGMKRLVPAIDYSLLHQQRHLLRWQRELLLWGQ